MNFEGQITVRRLLDRMSEIRIDESFHGPADQRNYVYDPTFPLRALPSYTSSSTAPRSSNPSLDINDKGCNR